MSFDFSKTLVRHALEQIGRPYIWAGEGDFVVRRGASGDLVPVTPESQGVIGLCFDCAGLVKYAALKAGSKYDTRGWWGADHLFTELPLRDPSEPFECRFYGRDQRATHIEIGLGNGLVLGAAGGDASTLTLSDAQKRGAKVRIAFETRRDFLAARSLEALQNLPFKPTGRAP